MKPEFGQGQEYITKQTLSIFILDQPSISNWVGIAFIIHLFESQNMLSQNVSISQNKHEAVDACLQVIGPESI